MWIQESLKCHCGMSPHICNLLLTKMFVCSMRLCFIVRDNRNTFSAAIDLLFLISEVTDLLSSEPLFILLCYFCINCCTWFVLVGSLRVTLINTFFCYCFFQRAYMTMLPLWYVLWSMGSPPLGSFTNHFQERQVWFLYIQSFLFNSIFTILVRHKARTKLMYKS